MKKYTNSSQFKATYFLESFYDYFEILKDITASEDDKILWYRGQFDEAWHLEPNLFRYSKETANYLGQEIDPMTPSFHFSSGYQVSFPNFVNELENFKKLVCDKFKGRVYLPKNEFEWLFLGQHYGLLTPLVDFTTDPLVALYFCTDGNRPNDKYQDMSACLSMFEQDGYSDDCAAVFVMLPEEINKYSYYKENIEGIQIDISKPVYIDDYTSGTFDGYVTRENVCFTPLCIVAPKIDYRLIRQSGNFLCYGENCQSIDYMSGYKHALYKIYIPYCIFQDLKNMLGLLDLTHKSIYGESTYTTFAMDSKQNALDAFDKQMKEISENLRKHER